MELFKIHGENALDYPEGYRVGWIAFDSDQLEKRVLFDSHPPKGIHFHIDGDEVGVGFAWESLSHCRGKFLKMICHHFDIDEKELLK